MILFPAIDLVAGAVVRLAKGDRARMDTYSKDPASVAGSMLDQGASWIHVVDLSSTFEEPLAARAANSAAIRDIATIGGLSLDVGGGVRTLKRIEELLDLGVKRVAMGTVLARDPALAAQAAREFGECLVADVAAEGGVVRVNGWREDTPLALDSLVRDLVAMGFRHLVFTDIAKDGMRTGIDAEAYRALAAVAGFPVVASGGVSSLDDLGALAALGDSVIEGVIVGRALYEGDITIPAALETLEAAC